MGSLKIPAEDFPPLVAIVGLSDASFASFVEAFAATTPSTSRTKYAAALAAKVKDIPEDVVSGVLNVLHSLYYVHKSKRVSIPQLVEALKQSARESEEFGRHFSKNEEILAGRFQKLLSLERPLGMTVKALDILSEHERLYCGSRIFSDIRPVFGDSPDSVSAAIVYHNLQIGFHNSTDGEHQELYFTLDDEDLSQLKATIERAQKKSIAIKALISSSKTSILEG